ncbi:anti-sigma factor family protein [Desulfovirgula thermocuniculi]|uniref:anti-sigma factor family protein n=1 Tax=Desulfovirgula thermocuniculi TaxID=348842 RepID=UPI000411FBC6|nr:zf-HC2 domain-containing protein [Desulfovirgula thermocuniculi]
MDCRRAEKEIFSWVDGDLPPGHEAELAAHLAVCPGCRKEAELWRAVTEALRSLPAAGPPEGFAAGVVARIRAEEGARRARTGWWRFLPPAARRGVAAAAAAALLLAGAGGFAARHWWPVGIPPQVAVNTGQSTPGSTVPEGASPPVTGTGGRSGELSAPAPPEGTGTREVTAAPPANSSKPQGPANGAPGRREASTTPQDGGAGPGKAPLVFLNRPRIIEETLLKVQVADLAAARSALLALGGQYERQEFGRQQLDGKTVEIWRFVIPAEKAGEFISAAGRLGKVTGRQDQTTDRTADFARALERYHSLLAQAAGGGENNSSLEAEINFLEQQLLNWDREAGQHVVVVLLEGK